MRLLSTTAVAALVVGLACSGGDEPSVTPRTPPVSEPEESQRVLPAPSRFVLPSPLQRNLEEAGELDQIADIGPMSRLRFVALVARAESAEEAGDSVAALEILEQLVIEAPPSAEVSFAIGRIASRAGDMEEAANHFERATRIDPNALSAPLALWLVYRTLGQSAEAQVVRLQVERRAHRLGEMLVGDSSEAEKLAAISGLNVEVPNLHAARALTRALDTDAFRVRVAALEALEQVAVPQAVSPIRRALREDPDSRYAPLYERVLSATASRELE
ncbi:MAG: tetratricopeptide (TPR) repeat protein [Bradymonadia bacterium]